MQTETKLKRADVASLIAASFPNYKGRTFRACSTDTVYFADLNWSGGSRSQYVILELATGRRADMKRLSANAPWNQPMEGASVPLPAGVVVVEHSTFCGKDMGLRFHYTPADRLCAPESSARAVEGA